MFYSSRKTRYITNIPFEFVLDESVDKLVSVRTPALSVCSFDVVDTILSRQKAY